MRFPTRMFAAAVASLALLSQGPAAAGTLHVNPVLIEIGEGSRSGAVSITNMDNAPVVIRVSAYAWHQESGEDRYDETAELVASPPIVTIPPGASQIVRVGPRQAANTPAAFRLFVEEVPGAVPDGGVRVALRLNLPLYVRMRPGRPDDLTWSARRAADGTWLVEARNRGTGWVRVDASLAAAATGLRFADGMAFGTVLPGGSRHWAVAGQPAIANQAVFRQISVALDDLSLSTLGR